MLFLSRCDRAPVSRVGFAIVGLTLLASPAVADPQSEISAYRKSYGLSAVTVDPKLTELARKQANAMAERRSMDHDVYASFSSRMASYGAVSAAENLAMGTKTFGATLTIWKYSWGHNANLLKRNVTRIGLASASSHGTTYWALILAAPAEPKHRSANQAAPAEPTNRSANQAAPAGSKQRSANQAASAESKQRSANHIGIQFLSTFPFVRIGRP
jgi:Cysteine-rich secretory protein family